MSLHTVVLKLKQDSNAYAQNPYLLPWDLKICQIIDDESPADDFLRRSKKEIMTYLEDCSLDYDQKLKRAYDVYAMTRFYIRFRRPLGLEKIPEEKNRKTPDFKGRLNNETFFMEMKTLGFVNEDNNIKDMLKTSLNGQIDLESQVKAGKPVALAEQSIQPFGKSPDSREIIEILIKKIDSLIEPGQFQLGDTLMVVDLSLLDVFPWANGMAPVYMDQKDAVSGILWNVAFGRAGHQIYKKPEFEGKSNLDGILSINGILIDRPFVKGLCFCTGHFWGDEKMLGLFRQEDGKIGEILRTSCLFYNNEKNRMPNKLVWS